VASGSPIAQLSSAPAAETVVAIWQRVETYTPSNPD